MLTVHSNVIQLHFSNKFLLKISAFNSEFNSITFKRIFRFNYVGERRDKQIHTLSGEVRNDQNIEIHVLLFTRRIYAMFMYCDLPDKIFSPMSFT